MKIVILESLGISDNEFNKLSKPLTDSGHDLIVHDDGKANEAMVRRDEITFDNIVKSGKGEQENVVL